MRTMARRPFGKLPLMHLNGLLPAHREICDYIAGMTDGNFLRSYQPALG